MDSKAKKFFQNDTPHGLVKRLILKKYLQAYIRMMLPRSKPNNKLTIIDGFAGTGIYENYGWSHKIEEYGSPIIALRVAIQHLLKRDFMLSTYEHDREIDSRCDTMLKELRPPKSLKYTTDEQTMSLVFVEASENTYKTLFKNVMKTLLIYGLKPQICPDFRNGTCIIHFDQIAVTLFFAKFKQLPPPQSPSFAFIDPFGFVDTPFTKVREFVGLEKEVLINFMTSKINDAISNSVRVGDILGLSIQEVKEWEASLTKTDDIMLNIVNKYQMCLKGESAKFSETFEMRNNEDATLYHLVYFTNHPRGLEEMKEAMNRGTQKVSKLCSSDYQIIEKGKPISFKNDQRNEDVADVILRKFEGSTVTISTVKEFILFHTPYVFRKTPLANLEKANKMEVVGPDKAHEARRAYTYPDGMLLKFSDYLGGSDEQGDGATTIQKKRDNTESVEDEPPAKTCKHEGSAAGNRSNTKTE